jgi:hypothetical protein
MRIKHYLDLQIGNDSDMKDMLFGPTDETLQEVIIDGYTKMAAGVFSVPLETTKELSLGDVAAVKGFYLEVDQDCSVKINSGTAIPVKRGNTTSGSLAKIFMEVALTKLEVVVASAGSGGVATNGNYCVWGDPSA